MISEIFPRRNYMYRYSNKKNRTLKIMPIHVYGSFFNSIDYDNVQFSFAMLTTMEDSPIIENKSEWYTAPSLLLDFSISSLYNTLATAKPK